MSVSAKRSRPGAASENGRQSTARHGGRKDLLTIQHLPVPTILHLLDRSDHYLTLLKTAGAFQKLKLLEGRTVANLFFENSTRTRTSFELAERRLGADAVTVAAAASSLSKGESILDTVRVLEAMKLDAIVVRHQTSGVPEFLAKHLPPDVHCINAGDGAHEHPTQALLDAAELRVALGDIKGKRIVIVGDITHSRVARSNMWLLKKLGASVAVLGPTTLIPNHLAEVFGVEVLTERTGGLQGADAVIALRIQLERQAGGYLPSLEEYRERYGITMKTLGESKAVVLHPGPVNVGLELDAATADSERSLILHQVKRGVAVRMAVLEWIFSE